MDEQLVAEQLFDGLTASDPETSEPRPALAESWTTSTDGLVWEFSLRSDATFSDGSPVEASDVKATLDRAVRPASGSVVADLLEPVVGWQAVVVEGTAEGLSGVEAVAARVVRVRLSRPWADFASALAHPGLGVVPRGSNDSTFESPFPGSGPFALRSRDADRLVLVETGGRARLPRVEIHLRASRGDAYRAFVEGDVDWAPVPLEKSDEAAARYGRAHFRSLAAELFYAFNLRSPKWADRRLREAVVRAVDTRRIIEEVYGGAMAPMRGLAVEGMLGAGDTCGDACNHDQARSRALLDQLRAEGGVPPEIFVDFEGDTAQAAVAATIEDDLEAVGLVVTLRPKPLDDYERFAVTGEQDLFRLGWIAPYASSDAVVAPLFESTSPNNLAGFSHPAVDDAISRARSEPDAGRRTALYQDAERMVFAEFALLPVGRFLHHSVATDAVRGIRLSVRGTFDASSVWLDDE
ncbi:MAG TPA: ABC transporter substrate-binding protein [Acidimicrobiales bacterium]|nr:ABC transporter substrate-binding protein [Acidimicrobiales bacterium]